LTAAAACGWFAAERRPIDICDCRIPAVYRRYRPQAPVSGSQSGQRRVGSDNTDLLHLTMYVKTFFYFFLFWSRFLRF